MSGWRLYKRQCTIWVMCTNTEVAKQGVRLLSRLMGEAWAACETIDLEELKTGGATYLLEYLVDRLEVQEVHLLGRALEDYFFSTRRAPQEHVNKWILRFKASYHRLLELKVELPQQAQAFFLLKRSNLSPSERQSILTLCGGKYEVEAICRAMQTLLVVGTRNDGQTPAVPRSSSHTSRTWQPSSHRSSGASSWGSSRSFKPKRSTTYYTDNLIPEVTWEDEPWDDEPEQQGAEELPPDGDYEVEGEEEFSGEDDDQVEEVEAYLTYLKAKAQQRTTKTSRGFFPGKGNSKGATKGKPSSSSSTQGVSPGGKGPGRDLSALKNTAFCRACGQQGHWANDPACPKGQGRGKGSKKYMGDVAWVCTAALSLKVPQQCSWQQVRTLWDLPWWIPGPIDQLWGKRG